MASNIQRPASEAENTCFRVAIKGVVLLHRQVLLVRNSGDEEWQLPGTFLAPLETPEQCIVRALSEKTDLQATIGRIIDSRTEQESFIVTYGCFLPSSTISNGLITQPNLKLFDLDEIAALSLSEGSKKSIWAWEDYLDG